MGNCFVSNGKRRSRSRLRAAVRVPAKDHPARQHERPREVKESKPDKPTENCCEAGEQPQQSSGQGKEDINERAKKFIIRQRKKMRGEEEKEKEKEVKSQYAEQSRAEQYKLEGKNEGGVSF